MTAGDLFKSGQLQAAIDAQLAEVRAKPGDMNRRLFLFELAAFAGDQERARRQTEMLVYDTPELQAAVSLYRNALDAEDARRALFAKGQPPQFFGSAPPAHVAKRLEALTELRSGRAKEAAGLLQEANDAAPPVKGEFNGKPFDGLRDADDLFGPVLEAFNNGRYFWLPLEQVAFVALNPPQFPRDLLWAPARVTLRDGTSGDLLLPALYPNSHTHADDNIKLGRATDWLSAVDGWVRGVGAKTFLVGEDAVGLLDWRELSIN
jgi:type VI secretion system protein ImpE